MYKNSVTIAREHRILMNNLLKEGCIFFTGAGISVSPPSSIPMANQIKKAILDSLLSIVDEDYKNKESIKVCLESHFYEMKMETLFEVFIRNGVTNIFECLRIFVQSVPNLDHLTIALLCKLGFVKAVFTLNFDLLHEAALKTIGIPYRSYLKDEDYFGFEYKTENKHVPIFHLHNGFLPDNSGDLGHLNAATSNVRSYLPHQKGGVLKHYLSSNPIFCTGYSNNDIDTFRYIEKFGVKIIWYSHNVYENIPERVKNLMSLKKTDFLHIVRNEEVLIETCFSDVILNVLGGDKRDELKKLINTEGSLSLNEKINYIEKLIKPLIISSSNSLLIISDLLDILNERLLALDILSDKCWESNYPNNEKQILFYRSRILSHIYERLGYSRKALRYSYQSVNLSDNNLYFRTLLISTLLGILKRNPYDLLSLLGYIIENNKLNKLLSDSPELLNEEDKQLLLFEKADFYDFLGGYLLFPSIIFLRLLLGSNHDIECKLVENYLSKNVLRILDKLIIIFTGWLLKFLENKALNYYSQVSSNIEIARGHAYLCACRCVEVLCFQKRFTDASRFIPILNDGLLFFDFSNELHGKGNIYLALYMYYHGINNGKYWEYYFQAKNCYGSHFSGQFKLLAMRYRVENDIYLS